MRFDSGLMIRYRLDLVIRFGSGKIDLSAGQFRHQITKIKFLNVDLVEQQLVRVEAIKKFAEKPHEQIFLRIGPLREVMRRAVLLELELAERMIQGGSGVLKQFIVRGAIYPHPKIGRVIEEFELHEAKYSRE